LISNSQRYAKLLTVTYPQVNDAIFFQSKEPAGNLGLCTGPSSTNYDRAFIALQYLDGSYSGDTNQIHQIACGQYSWYGTGGVILDTTVTATYFGVGTPSTNEDCARLCNYSYKNGTAPRCQAWQMSAAGVCEMNTQRAGGTAPSPAAAPSVTAAGIRIGGTTQTAVPAYKRDNVASPPSGRYDRRVPQPQPIYEIKPDYIIKGF
jgi:hypothetical protein